MVNNFTLPNHVFLNIFAAPMRAFVSKPKIMNQYFKEYKI
jgi:hypothetical protein